MTDLVSFLPPAAITLEDDRLCWPDVIVAEPQGFRPLLLDLFRPAHATDVPVVVWIHGGGWRLGTNKRESPFLAPARIGERILAAGYALARVTYRLSGEAVFPAQLHDVKSAIRWLRHHATELGLDPARIAVWGESAGGHLAALAALTGDDPELAGDGGIVGVSDAVQACVAWYAPTNLLTMAAQNHPQGEQDHDAPDSAESMLVGGPIQQLPAQSAAASPVTYATADGPPMLLVHGDDDRLVPDAQSRELHERIVGLGGQAELEIVPGADHCFQGADLGSLTGDALAFLRRALAT